MSETKAVTFTRPRKYISSSGTKPPELGYVDIRTLADSVCRYDLSDVDVAWLQLANEEFKEMGEQWAFVQVLFWFSFLFCLKAGKVEKNFEGGVSGGKMWLEVWRAGGHLQVAAVLV